jgi:hypothetical protein
MSTIQKHSIENSNAAIYAVTENLNYFLASDLTPDEAAGVTNEQASVSSFTRRRYAGDTTPINVSSHQREYMVDPGRRNGSATPGKEMILDDGTERRSFTYTGPWMDVHAFLVTGLKTGITKCYSESARYDITVAAQG